ncbi:MAG: manganese efflux pump [Ruminococcaceae bacterium]|nr:manganese efflux pump [Oscillospiraceae bacterium]
MALWELFIIAVGLSMDAFAVAVCKGLSLGKVKLKQTVLVGLYFGAFQALMPLLGYWLGSNFADIVESVDHWIAFVLLGAIGFNMIRESRSESESVNSSLTFRAMLPLALATSIDALAVGVTFAFMRVQIVPAVVFIGVITFALSAVGTKIGSAVGARFEKKAELLGGIILILMGIKILLEHLGII